jgi:hypothetical protein
VRARGQGHRGGRDAPCQGTSLRRAETRPEAGYIDVGGTIVALAIGEVVSDTLYVHVEKARVDYAGAYQAIVSLFAKNALEEGTLYINREDDSGEERLRYSKMSYRPIRLIDKYWVTLENPA